MTDDIRRATKGAVAVLASEPSVVFAVLIGSRATGRALETSDWDIAVQWGFSLSYMQRVERSELLRQELARTLGVPDRNIDLVDLTNASLAMRAAVAEEGVPLCGEESLDWVRFLTRTWREIEDHYWQKHHAA
jgi:predicted nucleotidyltransferase